MDEYRVILAIEIEIWNDLIGDKKAGGFGEKKRIK